MNGDYKYTFDDVFLVPRYSRLASRSDADVSLTLGGFQFHVPVAPSNMRCVIDAKLAKQLSNDGYLYMMHRFGVDIYDFVETATKEAWQLVSISVGVSDSDLEVLTKISKADYALDFITVDIAHGHCFRMRDMLLNIRKKFPKVFIIAGNVATPDGVSDLQSWGANAIKVGIGGGSVCSTKLKTGFTYPMFSSLWECSEHAEVPLISDGGAVHNGDIAKALVAGASLVMSGSMFIGCHDSPAKTVRNGTDYSKVYYGSASAQNKGERKHVEGFEKTVPGNGLSYKEKFLEIEEDLSSAVSYAGGSDLSAFYDVEYGVQK